jgi:hypothetical protein
MEINGITIPESRTGLGLGRGRPADTMAFAVQHGVRPMTRAVPLATSGALEAS